MQLSTILETLEAFAPLALAEEWDNVGLLLGDRGSDVSRVMTCLTLTSDVAEEAVAQRAGLIVTHHPVLFRAVKRLTCDTIEGEMLLRLIQAGVAVYSPHTAFDSAATGINQQLAERFRLVDIQPLRPVPVAAASSPAVLQEGPDSVNQSHGAIAGGGRWGRLPSPMLLKDFAKQVEEKLGVSWTHFVGDREQVVETVAVACGAAAEYLTDAHRAGCDVLMTGEARFHSCLEARALGIGLVLPGHYATERPAVESLAKTLQQQFPHCVVWASAAENDPMQWC